MTPPSNLLRPQLFLGQGFMPLVAILVLAFLLSPAPLGAQELPGLADEVLARTEAALHVDVQTGRVAGVTRSGPVAEIGAKIVEVLFGDYTSGEWLGYAKRIEGEYVKPAVSARLVLLGREGGLTAERHVPDYLLRSANNALLHVEIRKTAPYDRGKGNISVTHTATVRAALQGDFKPGETVEFTEETRRKHRFEPLASRERIVLLTYSRSVRDGEMYWWLHERVNYGYTEAGLATLRADLARVRATQAEKAGR
jgi:hypothetical protein